MPSVSFNPFRTIVSVKTFEMQLEAVAEKYSIVPLRDVAERRVRPTGDQFVITFDDGYRDNYELAFPILEKRGLSATFFVVTGSIGMERPLWDWELATRLCAGTDVNEVEMGDVVFHRKTNELCHSFAKRVIKHLRSASLEELEQVLEGLRNRPDHSKGSEPTVCMTWGQVRTLDRKGMEIGAHGVTHRSLSGLAHADAIHEIVESKRAVEENINGPCRHFAFPFGSTQDYNEGLLRAVGETGFQTCMLNVHGYNHILEETSCFKRIIMTEMTDVQHLLG